MDFKNRHGIGRERRGSENIYIIYTYTCVYIICICTYFPPTQPTSFSHPTLFRVVFKELFKQVTMLHCGGFDGRMFFAGGAGLKVSIFQLQTGLHNKLSSC